MIIDPDVVIIGQNNDEVDDDDDDCQWRLARPKSPDLFVRRVAVIAIQTVV